jgi:hypothetical protein
MACLALAVVATALDGAPGALAAVIVAATVLAGVRPRSVGLVGLLALAATPVVVLLDGVPSRNEVSPAFVSRSMWPHHLTFVGFVLLGAAVVMELGPALRAHLHDDVVPPGVPADAPDAPVAGPLGRAPASLRVALVVVVALGALAACIGVLQA